MIEFVSTDIDVMLKEIILDYENAYLEQTGVRTKLAKGDPIRIFLYTQALREYHLRVAINKSANMNLLRFSKGNYLEELGNLMDTKKLVAKGSKVMVRFHLSDAQLSDFLIPMHTKVLYEGLFFEVVEDAFIRAGELFGDAKCVCMTPGSVGNGIAVGSIKTLVDPIPFVKSVENINISYDGSDEESDDNLRERIHMAPEGYSVAGPSGAYKKFAKDFSNNINDIEVKSSLPGVVDVIVLIDDETDEFLEDLKEYLNDTERRPLTDKVEVKYAEPIDYEIELTYYKKQKVDVSSAIENYKLWQSEKIGRDINPSKLHELIMLQGAKRVEIVKPNFMKLSKEQCARCIGMNVKDGGFEDD